MMAKMEEKQTAEKDKTKNKKEEKVNDTRVGISCRNPRFHTTAYLPVITCYHNNVHSVIIQVAGIGVNTRFLPESVGSNLG